MSSSVSIDRPCGAFSVDGNGAATYELAFDLPPGIGQANTPDISLRYNQTFPNGLTGIGWALYGLSSIQRAPPNLAVDGFNGPLTYSFDGSRLALDGTELILSAGQYGQDGAQYVFEIDNGGRVVTSLGGGLQLGFKITDATGRTREYGTTKDSLSLSADGQNVREWRLARDYDVYGNCATFSYTKNPKLRDGTSAGTAQQVTYPDRISYSSNKAQNVAANRFVDFYYAPRYDEVVATGAGDVFEMSYRLVRVQTSVQPAPTAPLVQARAYNIDYIYSGISNASLVSTITEEGAEGSTLSPTTVKYNSTLTDPATWFKPGPQRFSLGNNGNFGRIEAILPLHVSGYGLSDLAVVTQNQATGVLTIDTYLASIATAAGAGGGDNSLSWAPSQSLDSSSVLPLIDANTTPAFIPSDIDGNGQNDFVMAFSSRGGLQFSVSHCTGQGFSDYTLVDTPYPWSPEDIFFAMDCNGNGRIDIVQITSVQGDVLIRAYFADSFGDQGALEDTLEVLTGDDASNTIQWFPADVNRDGLQDLVRVWYEQDSNSICYLYATVYLARRASDQSATFEKGNTVSLGTYMFPELQQVSVFPCDVNADGIQDLMTCRMNQVTGSDTTLTFDLQVFLCDGIGGFKSYSTQTLTYTVLGQTSPIEDAKLEVVDLDGSGILSMVYRFEDLNGDQNVLIARGGYSAYFREWTALKLFGSEAILGKSEKLLLADIDGTAKAGWFAYSLDEVFAANILPIFNVQPLSDILTSITDPLGLTTTPQYETLSSPSVYKPALDQDATKSVEALRLSSSTLPNQGPFESVMGFPQYVVSSFSQSNDPSRNGLPVSYTTTKFYEGARIDLGGRGWQGFSRIYTVIDDSPSAVTVETLAQDWPLTGQTIQQDVYDTGLASAASPITFPSLGQKDLVSSKVFDLIATPTSVKGGTTYLVNRQSEQSLMYDNGAVSLGSGTSYTYTVKGYVQTETKFVLDPLSTGKQTFQKGVMYAYYTLGLLQGVLKAKKTTTVQAYLTEGESDWTGAFKDGDIELLKRDCDKVTGSTLTENVWSIQSKAWIPSTYGYDPFGNMKSYTDQAGLLKTTTYDTVYNTFPIQVEESGSKMKVTLTTQLAFDARFGASVGRMEPGGLLKRVDLDEFGREVSTKITSLPLATTSSTPLPASFVGPQQLLGALVTQKLDTVSQTSYEITTVGAQLVQVRQRMNWLQATNSDSASRVSEYVDCAGRVQQSSTVDSRTGVLIMKTFDSLGNILTESAPINLYENPTPQWTQKWYDALRRPIKELRAQPTQTDNRLLITTQYSKGGSHVVTTENSIAPGSSTPSSAPLSSVTLDLSWCAGELKVTTSTDSDQNQTSFKYDVAGNLAQAIDPGLNIDFTNYDLQGFLVSRDNMYQNPNSAATKAVQYTYDSAGRKATETNAMAQKNTFHYDEKGRLILRENFDGRQINLGYDETPTGYGSLTSATVSKPNVSDLESKYVFSYDQHGLPMQTDLTVWLAGSSSKTYRTLYTYDLQGQLTSKTQPDGSIIRASRRGSNLSTCSLSSDSSLTPAWQVNGNFSYYDATGRCTDWYITSAGSVGSCVFFGKAKSDSFGTLLSRSFSQDVGFSPALVQESYSLDDLRRIKTYQEAVENESVNYTYKNQRLHTSTPANGKTATYDYDTSGNLQGKNGISFTYSKGSVSGKSGSSDVLYVQYDDCGRMVTRQYNNKTFNFTYDGFGKLSSITNSQAQQNTQVTNNFLGRKLTQVDPDGSVNIRVSPDYSVTIATDGSETAERSLYGADSLLASVTNPTNKSAASSDLDIMFSNSKGNITRVFENTGTLRRQLKYDDFGMLAESDMTSQAELSKTYETQYMSLDTGLLDFGARSYDPVLGRFTTPDDEWSNDPLTGRDVLNRYAFENNDPINSSDPSGHRTGSSWAGLWIGVGLVVLGIALTVATGGIASAIGVAPFIVAAGAGALTGGGLAGISYAATHDEDFSWGAYFTNVGVSAVTGAVLGAAGPLMATTRFLNIARRIQYFRSGQTAGRFKDFMLLMRGRNPINGLDNLTRKSKIDTFFFSIGAKATLGGGSAVVDQAVYNWTNGDPLSKDLGMAAVAGVGFGVVGAAAEFGIPLIGKTGRFETRFLNPPANPESLFKLTAESWRAVAVSADALNMVTAVFHAEKTMRNRKKGNS